MFCFEHNSLNYKINDKTNKFLLAGDKFMPEIYLTEHGFPIVFVNHLQELKKEYKSLNKLKIQDTFTKTN